VSLEPLALARHRPVPIQSEPLEVGEDARLVNRSRALRVEILDAQHKAPAA
jgi:hypothetical protein